MNQFMPLFRKENQQIISQIFDLENTVLETTSPPSTHVRTYTGLSPNKKNKILYKIPTLVVYFSKSHKIDPFNSNHLEDLFVSTRAPTIYPIS